MNLSTLKKEAREELQAHISHEDGTTRVSTKWIDTLIDKVIEAVEEGVVPELSAAYGMSRGEDRTDQDVRDDTILGIKEAFTNFKK